MAIGYGHDKTNRMTTLAASTQSVWLRLAEAIGRKDLTTNPKFIDNSARVENSVEVNGIVGAWIEQHTRGVHTPPGDSDARTQAVEARRYPEARIGRTGARNASDRVKAAIGRSAKLPEREYRDGC